MKINSTQALSGAIGGHHTLELDDLIDEASSRYGKPSDNNFYLFRDFLRLNWSGASGVLLEDGTSWVPVDGGNARHFLHVSTDDSNKVAYTKDEDRGRDDVQTRTTAAAYFEKYGRAPRNQDTIVTSTPEAPTPEAPTPEAPTPEAPTPGATGAPAAPDDDGAAIVAAIITSLKAREGRNSATSKDIVDAVAKALDILLVVAYK
jgi:hypothetical protein